MIDSFYIYSKATEMVKQTGTRNPMKIASEIGVMLRYSDELDKLLGLYTYRWKHRIILLNGGNNGTNGLRSRAWTRCPS